MARSFSETVDDVEGHRHNDAANSQWHDECTALLRPFNIGYYVGESDAVNRPSNAANPSRRKTGNGWPILRDKYDPDGVFLAASTVSSTQSRHDSAISIPRFCSSVTPCRCALCDISSIFWKFV